MNLIHIVILACIQGAAELLPVSSSAHVIVAQKLMGYNPSTPEATFLLVMLHTGTMGAVILYFWGRWRHMLTSRSPERTVFIRGVVLATAATGIFGFGLKIAIEKTLLAHESHAEIELLFKSLPAISLALAAVGLIILFTGIRTDKKNLTAPLTSRSALAIGVIQGICLPFRGFSRSGATISMALNYGLGRILAEEFSFALAVVLTPPVIVRELLRLLKHKQGEGASHLDIVHSLLPGTIGMVFSLLAGLVALRLLSAFIERGRWKFFGIYCLAFSAVVYALHLKGY